MIRPSMAAAGAALALASCGDQPPTANTVRPAATVQSESAIAAGQATPGGPFGLAMAQPLASLHVQKQLDGDERYSITPPAANPEFEEYIVQAPPKTGLCRVSGVGVTHHGDATGAKIRTTLASFTQALDAKYGAHETEDSLDDHSSLTRPESFAAGLENHERTLTRTWSRGGGARLPTGLQEIIAYAKAVDADGTYLQLTYEFANYDACLGRDRASAGDVGRAL